jgi:hypothetical protein
VIFLACAMGSLALVLFPRVAWEVCAFQVLLAALCMAASIRILNGEGSLLRWSLAYCLAVSLGTANHFIFISLPLACSVAGTLLAALSPSRGSLRFVALQAAGLGVAGAIFLMKPSLDEQEYLQYRQVLNLSVWLFLPAVGGAAVALIGQRTRWMATARIARARLFKAKPGGPMSFPGVLLGLLAAASLATGITIFALTHGAALLGTTAGHLPLMRIAHQAPAAWALAAHYVLAGSWILCAFLGFAWVLLPSCFVSRIRLLPSERLLLLAPLSYFCVFPLFIDRNAPRYYILANLLLAMSFATVSARWLTATGRGARALGQGAVAALAAGVVATQATLWGVLISPELRSPVRVDYAGYHDTSEHFLDLEELHELLRVEGVCEIRESGFFIETPLTFLRQVRPYPCRPGVFAKVHYCRDCLATPRYFSVSISDG